MPSAWDLQTILSRFRFSAADCAVEPLTSGLINTTYCLTDQGDRRRYILQRINQSVFPRPDDIAANIRRVADHLQAHHLA